MCLACKGLGTLHTPPHLVLAASLRDQHAHFTHRDAEAQRVEEENRGVTSCSHNHPRAHGTVVTIAHWEP